MSGNTESVPDTQTQREHSCQPRSLDKRNRPEKLDSEEKNCYEENIVSIIASDRMTMSTEILKEEEMREEDGIIESEDEDIDVGSNESYRYI